MSFLTNVACIIGTGDLTVFAFICDADVIYHVIAIFTFLGYTRAGFALDVGGIHILTNMATATAVIDIARPIHADAAADIGISGVWTIIVTFAIFADRRTVRRVFTRIVVRTAVRHAIIFAHIAIYMLIGTAQSACTGFADLVRCALAAVFPVAIRTGLRNSSGTLFIANLTTAAFIAFGIA